MTPQQDKIKGLLILIKTNKGVYEVSLSTLCKKEILKKIEEYGKIVLVGNDLSETIKF